MLEKDVIQDAGGSGDWRLYRLSSIVDDFDKYDPMDYLPCIGEMLSYITSPNQMIIYHPLEDRWFFEMPLMECIGGICL